MKTALSTFVKWLSWVGLFLAIINSLVKIRGSDLLVEQLAGGERNLFENLSAFLGFLCAIAICEIYEHIHRKKTSPNSLNNHR